MIGAIVFSKDRACQLDLLLTSLERNAPGFFDVSVLWTGEQQAYSICESEHPEARFIPEDGLTYQVRYLVEQTKTVTFLTDDSVLYREVMLEPILTLAQERVLTFSLRLGQNTSICYPHDSRQIVPESPDGPVKLWRWRGAQGDFGYPMSLDGHIFRSADISRLIQDRHFSTPNSLEEMLMSQKIGRPLMASYPHSCLVGIPVNRVQHTHPNRAGEKHPFGPDALNARYLVGERIDLDALDFSDIRGAHQEIELVLA